MPPDKLASLMPTRNRRGGQADRRSNRPNRGKARLVRLLDRDGDGNVELDDLQKLFSELDKNNDQTLQSGELGTRPQRRGQRKDATKLPRKGQVAPDFDLPFVSGATGNFKLSSFAGKKPVALIFGSYT